MIHKDILERNNNGNTNPLYHKMDTFLLTFALLGHLVKGECPKSRVDHSKLNVYGVFGTQLKAL